MSRVMKFRAWSEKERKYYYSDDRNQFPESWMFWRFVVRHNLPVEQFAGLHEKNGIEIYEGDVLRNHGDNNQVEVVGGRARIITTSGHGDSSFTAGVTYYSGYGDSSQIEVIGNIHENPELMKE